MTKDTLAALCRRPIPEEKAVVVQAAGLFCPMPLVELGKAMRMHSRSELFVLYATDPGTGPDLLAWAGGWKHTVVAIRLREDTEAQKGCSAAEQLPEQLAKQSQDQEDRYWVRRGNG